MGIVPSRGRLSLVLVSCRDDKTQTLYLQNEAWLRPGLRGNRVEYCRCVAGRVHCHSVPVRGTYARRRSFEHPRPALRPAPRVSPAPRGRNFRGRFGACWASG